MPLIRRYDEAEPQRVNRWLAQAGICSRREAEALIGQGLVSIDGVPVTDPGHKIGPGETLTLADRATDDLGAAMSVMLHKPVGIVSSQPEPGQVPAVRLLTRANLWDGRPRGLDGKEGVAVPGRDSRLAPIGRLDRDSRGLLILSEDGVVAKAVIGPASTLDKEYVVAVGGEITERKLGLLRHGLHLDGRQLKPAKVTRVGPDRLRFVLTEGRNRQIRRMCDLVGLSVSDLLRVRIGPIRLDDLPESRWRPLTAEERAALIRG